MIGSARGGLGSIKTAQDGEEPPAGGAGPFPGFGGAPPAVAAASSAGAAATASHSDHTHAGVASVASTDPALPVTTTGAAVTAKQLIQASWSIAGLRVYAVDPAGNDASAGFADAAGQTAGDLAAASAAAGLVAKKTIAGLAAIFPHVGAGRRVQITLAAGTYADSLSGVLNGVSGYARLCVNATATNATAGSTAFAGDVAANVFCGDVTGTGLNAAGYNPIGVPTTTVLQLQLAGGGAAALPAEPALPLLARIRFDNNAPTQVALRGQCRTVIKVAGTDTVTVDAALSAVPVATDVLYLEMPGVNVPASILAASDCVLCSLGGVNFTGALQIESGLWIIGNCAAASYTAEMPANVQTNRFYQTVLGNVTSGGGLRVAGTVTNGFFGGQRLSAVEGLFVGSVELLGGASYHSIQSSIFAAGIAIQGGNNSTQQADQSDRVGGPSAVAAMRITGPTAGVGGPAGLLLRGTDQHLGFIDIQGMGAAPAIKLVGQNRIVFGNVVSGASGNTGVGLDLSASYNSLIILLATPTVTGTIGDVALGGGPIVTWAQLAATGITDTNGNRIVSLGSTGLHTIANFIGLIVPDGAVPAFTYFANPGQTLWSLVAMQNEGVAMRYPTSLRIFARLRVTALVSAPTGGVVFTLYKGTGGGAPAATAQTLTVPAGTPAGTVFVDSAHPILFADGDTFDVRADFGASGEGNFVYAVTLEGP